MSSSPPPETSRPNHPTTPQAATTHPACEAGHQHRGPDHAVCVVVGVATEIFLSHTWSTKSTASWCRSIREAATTAPAGVTVTTLDSCSRARPRADPRASTARTRTRAGHLTAAIVGDQVVSAGIINPKATGGCSAVPSTAYDALLTLPTDGSVHTVSIPGYGDYRAAASNHGSVTVITGMPLAPVRASLVQLGLIMAIVTGLALIAGAVVVIWIVRRSCDRWTGSRPRPARSAPCRWTAARSSWACGVPDEDTDPRTEVGQVGAALNQMLGHVSNALAARQASEMRVRQFVADASHELRTPLAAIRGYAELARREEDDTEGVAHALRRVESESARMTTLVDDLLLLARLDSGRPLSADEVDLTMLAVDAVSDARVAGPLHRWQLDLPEEPVVTIGDQARLHQVWSTCWRTPAPTPHQERRCCADCGRTGTARSSR